MKLWKKVGKKGGEEVLISNNKGDFGILKLFFLLISGGKIKKVVNFAFDFEDKRENDKFKKEKGTAVGAPNSSELIR